MGFGLLWRGSNDGVRRAEIGKQRFTDRSAARSQLCWLTGLLPGPRGLLPLSAGWLGFKAMGGWQAITDSTESF